MTGDFNHPMNKKVKCWVYLRDLQAETGLSDDAIRHIALIAGPRFNPCLESSPPANGMQGVVFLPGVPAFAKPPTRTFYRYTEQALDRGIRHLCNCSVELFPDVASFLYSGCFIAPACRNILKDGSPSETQIGKK